MMAAQPKATGGGDKKSEAYHRGLVNPSDPNGNIPLDDAGIDKNLAKRAASLHLFDHLVSPAAQRQRHGMPSAWAVLRAISERTAKQHLAPAGGARW
jgi:hypothetical protein